MSGLRTTSLSVIFGAVISLLLFVNAIAGDSAEIEDAENIRKVIEKQLEALRRDDWIEAFSYAAPMIQEKFGSPEGFRRMILTAYRIVYRPLTIKFKDFKVISGRPSQTVYFVGKNGSSALLVYFMSKQKDGVWRISGVELFRPAEKSA